MSSKPSVQTLNEKDIPSSRYLFQLVPSVRHTEETESGLLLTPSTVDIGLTEGRMEKGIAYRESIGRHYVPGCLSEQIQGLLPTPDCSDRRSDNSTQWGLTNYAKNGLLPTPATRDYKGARSTEALEKSGRNETNNLSDHFHQPGKTSQLNPRFVAEMMGYPPDYLELPFLGHRNESIKAYGNAIVPQIAYQIFKAIEKIDSQQ